MKLNNRGMTLIEIIVSIVLISIVILFLSMLLIDVKDINYDSKSNSTYLINKAILIKNIEEDLIKYASDDIAISSCNVSDIYSNYKIEDLEENEQANECLKIKYDSNNVSYLGIFYSLSSSTDSYIVFYSHGTTQRNAKELKEFEKYNVTDGKIKNKMFILLPDGTKRTYDSLGTYSSTDKVSITINIPVIGNDGKDYTITIPYYGKVTIE